MSTEAIQLARLALSALSAEERAAVIREHAGNAERPESLRLLRPGEAAEALQVSRATLWRMTKEGRVRTVALRKGAIRYPEAELRRLVEGRNR